MITNLLILTFSIVYIIGHSGIVMDLSKFIYTNTHKEKWNYQIIGKPFSCYGCMTFWSTLIYSLIMSMNIIQAIGIASLMSIVAILIDKLIHIVIKLINKIQ